MIYLVRSKNKGGEIMNDRLRLHLCKRTIVKVLEGTTLKEFLKLTEPVKLELFNMFLLLKKGR